MCFAPSGVANIHNVFFRHSSPSVPFWTENNICGSLSGILYCSSTAQRPRAQTLAAQASPHNQRHVKSLQQSAFIITKRQPALITMLRASTGWGRSTRTATQILGFVISRPSLLSPVPSARNSVLGALQYVPLQCASLHMNLMTSQTLHSRWAARKGSAVHGRLAHLWRPPHPWGRLPAVDRVAGPLPWATVASAALLSTGRVCSSLAARARPMSFANGCFFDCSVRRIAFDLWWHNVFGRLVHVHDF